MQKKQIIFFTSHVPLPPNGGGTRSFHILKALSEFGEVDLVILNSISTKEKETLQTICQQVLFVDADTTIHQRKFFKKIIVGIKLLLPFLMSDYELNGRIHSLLPKKNIQAPFLNFILFKWLLAWFKLRNPYPFGVYLHENAIIYLQKNINQLLQEPGKILVFDFNYFLPVLADKFNLGGHKLIGNSHNVESDLLKQGLPREQNPLYNSWKKFQYQLMENAERKSLKIANVSFCCSEGDKKKYQQLDANSTIEVIPNGVDMNYFYLSAQQETKLTLLFTGTMNYGPNMEGVKWFLNNVFPILLKKYPTLIFIIAGKHADKLIIPDTRNTRIVSNPGDMRPYFNEACIYIVPLKQGSGTRLKILEAAAMQKPVVSTTIGAEGLEGLDSNNILLADIESAFSEAICLLLEDADKRKNLSGNLYNWVKTNYSWENIHEKIEKVIMDVA